eukprot:31392-Pelagococcus_subviridis.AAC.13
MTRVPRRPRGVVASEERRGNAARTGRPFLINIKKSLLLSSSAPPPWSQALHVAPQLVQRLRQPIPGRLRRFHGVLRGDRGVRPRRRHRAHASRRGADLPLRCVPYKAMSGWS